MTSSIVPANPANGSTVASSPTLIGFTLTTDQAIGTAYSYSWELRQVSNNALIASGSTGGVMPSASFLDNNSLTITLTPGVAYKYRVTTFTLGTDSGGGGTFATFTLAVNNAPTTSLVSPAAGAAPGTLTPTFTVGFSDPDTGTYGTFSAYQMQFRRVSDGTSFYDTNWVATSAGEKTARQASKVYAGTTLVNGTAYEWRARSRDGAGLESSYTAWQTFTPSLAPNAPTITSPSGLTNTLTPTIAGTYSQGSGGTETEFQYEVRQSTVTIYSSGDVAADISTGQAFGTDNSGDTPSTPPTLSWGTSYEVRARSKDNLGVYSDWSNWQAFNTNAAPTTPTGLSPNNNAITGDTTPTLMWTHNDPDGDAQTAVEIDIYDITNDAVVTDYNPKALSQATLTHTVLTTLDDSPANHRWRIRTKGLAGPGFGPWSDWAPFTVAEVPVVAMTEPDPDEVITTSSFLVTWTFSGGSGTQASYRIRVYADDGATLVYDSGVVPSTDTSATVPSGYLRNAESYYFNLVVADSLAQEADSGLVAVTTVFTPPASVTGLTATPTGGDVL